METQQLSFGQRLRVATRAAIGIFSDQSMTQAYGLLRGVLPGGMGIPPTRGTADYLKAYSQMPWLRAAAGRVATAVASAEWQLYVVKKGKEKAQAGGRVTRMQRAPAGVRRKLLKGAAEREDLKQIETHPLLDLLNNANEFQTGLQMRKVTQLHLDLTGDCFWLKERDAQGTPIAVWPIPPHWIIATPTPAFRFFRVSFRAWRGIIPDTEFTWFSDDDPLFPYGRGTGVAQALGDELETDEYAARMTKAFFYNNARPDLIVWPKGGNLTPGNSKRLEEDWMSQAQGFFRSFKPYFLTREVNVKELDQNFRAIQLVQLREHERNTILQVFGLPPEILGVLENSNRSTIDAASYLMSRYVVEPRLEFLRTVMQERLVPEYDERLILEYVSPVDEDKAAQVEAAKAAPFALSIDDWRKLAGLPPLEDEDAGKLHALASTSKLIDPVIEAEDIANPPEPPPQLAPFAGQVNPPGVPPVVDPNAPPAPPTLPVPPKTPPTDEEKPKAAYKALLFGDVAAALDAGDAALAASLKRVTSLDVDALPVPSQIAARQEPGTARALVRAWTTHAERLSLRALTAALGPDGTPGDVVDLLDVHGLGTSQTAAIQPALQRAGSSGADVGARALRRHGVGVRGPGEITTKPNLLVDLAGVNHAVTAWAKEHAAALVQAPAEVRDIIRRLIERANEEGIEPERVARLIRDSIGLTAQQVNAVMNFHNKLLSAENPPADDVVEARVARYAAAQLRARALTIARTELIASLNAGQQSLWKQAVAQGAIKDDQFEQVWLVTEDDLLDTEICEPLTDATAAIGEDFDGGYSGPPAHPNCRCAVGLQPSEGGKAFRRALSTIEIHNHLPAPESAAPTVTVNTGGKRTITLLHDAHGHVTGGEVEG